jgi:DNA end-binding protein Ku
LHARNLERQHQFWSRQYSHCSLSRYTARGVQVSSAAQKRFESRQLQARRRKGWQRSSLGPNREGLRVRKRKIRRAEGEDFERVDLEATQTVDIQDFVNVDEIDPIYFYKPYYLEPQKGGDKAYALLRDALKDIKKVGIAKVVIKTRQYLAGVKPEDGALVLELMHFADELADTGKLHLPKKVEVGKREMNMAKSLIDNMSSKWDPEKYRDDYREALMEVIEEKVEAGGKEIEAKPKKAPKPTKVIDLVSVLQKSLKQTSAKTKSTVKSRAKQKQPAKKAA